MSSFPKKQFQGVTYDFAHLAPAQHHVAPAAASTVSVAVHVTFSIHCFTEEFEPGKHQDHHRYTYGEEMRAFDLTRYNCSLALPNIMANFGRAMVYRARYDNYTYVASIPVDGQLSPYSLFFTLASTGTPANPSVRVYVQSAYLKGLTVAANAESWRFGSLLGQATGLFQPKAKKEKPKKKAP